MECREYETSRYDYLDDTEVVTCQIISIWLLGFN